MKDMWGRSGRQRCTGCVLPGSAPTVRLHSASGARQHGSTAGEGVHITGGNVREG
jgi:hypothetical protein